MRIVKAPQPYPVDIYPRLFLAGSIEMGQAEPWQTWLEKELLSRGGLILNPRRDDWDSTWAQSIDNPQFREQVEWELEALERADIIPLYFDPTTKSPITLLELGLFAKFGRLVVYCPEGFWRKGNVDIVCNRYKIELTDNKDDFLAAVNRRVSSFGKEIEEGEN